MSELQALTRDGILTTKDKFNVNLTSLTSIDSARSDEELLSKLERKDSQLNLLLDLTSGLASNLDLNQALQAACVNIRRLMKCDGVGIMGVVPELNQLSVLAGDFPSSRVIVPQSDGLVPTDDLPDRVFRTGQPAVLRGAEIDAVGDLKLTAEGIRSIVMLPLISKGRNLGTLIWGERSEREYSPEDLSFLAQVANQAALAIDNALAYREIAGLKDKLAQEKLYLEDEIQGEMHFDHELHFGEIIGNSESLRQVLQLVETVASSDSTVLLLGETGTGKELIARAIHNHSRRHHRTFIKLNCAAIPTGLLESELFGHERGAFTGAIAQKIGRLELADLGTLFLDEIGDISLELQPKLLRALQEREFERLGGNRTRKVDVRLVAATNRNLQQMVEDREFRSDLYYRLNVFPIRIPPLRERPGDIPLLVHYFTEKCARRMEKKIDSIPAEAMRKLESWHWPGNIRELENFIERCVILTRGSTLYVPVAELSQTEPVTGFRTADERQQILSALKEAGGRVAGPDGAAVRLGLKRTTLLSRMKKLGINPRRAS